MTISTIERKTTATMAQELRYKLNKRGVESMSDSELLALCLAPGLRTRDAMEIANDLINQYGGLLAVMNSDRRDIRRMPGISEAKQAQLTASMEVCRRTVYETLEKGDVLSSPGKVREYLSMQLAGLPHEVFAALFLDNRHRVLEYRVLFNGTIDGASVYPRQVVKSCLSTNAAAVIFCHNHPSGVAEPSDADVNITRKLIDALALIDVRVLDHLIIGAGIQTSLAERGLM